MTSNKNTTKDNTLRKIHLVIDRLVSSGKAVAHADSSIHKIFPAAINAAEGTALRDWVVKEKASHTVEIGLAYGISVLFICEGLITNGDKNARHVALDPYQDKSFKNLGLQSLEEAGVANLVEYHEEESQTILPRFVKEGRHFDFAFVDGSHLFDRVFLDLIYLGRLVRPGGIIFVDDYHAQAVAKATSFCLTNLGWKLEETSHSDEHHQWAVLRTAPEPITRSYPHFVDF